VWQTGSTFGSDHLALDRLDTGAGVVLGSSRAGMAPPYSNGSSGPVHRAWPHRSVLAPGCTCITPSAVMLRIRPTLAAFLIGLATGAAIWLLSPLISGRREPWDAEGVYYTGALFGAGFLGGFLLPQQSRWFVAGIFVGQVVVLLGGVLHDPSNGGLWPLGLAFLALYSLLALLGEVLGSTGRRLRSRRTP
jgi:hypothetical protein